MSTATLITVLVALVLPASVAGGWWLGGQPELARVRVTGGEIRIVPRGVLRLLSFRRELVLDRLALRRAAVVTCASLPPAGLRSPGLAIPGLRAGTYECPEATSYWLVGRAARVLRLDFADGPIGYVVVQVRDPDGLAALLGGDARPAVGLAGPRPPGTEP